MSKDSVWLVIEYDGIKDYIDIDWIDVNEQLPEDSQIYLFYDQAKDMIHLGRYMQLDNLWITIITHMKIENVSFWAKIPDNVYGWKLKEPNLE